MFNKSKEYIQEDKRNIWHPFTQHKLAGDPLPISRGQGAYLYTPEGRKIFDGISSWWVTLHGHCHPHIASRVKEQLDTLDHVIFADVTHPNAINLSKKLISLLDSEMSKVFYSDNGSTAVEVAIKMALQFWFNQKAKRRKIIVTTRAH